MLLILSFLMVLKLNYFSLWVTLQKENSRCTGMRSITVSTMDLYDMNTYLYEKKSFSSINVKWVEKLNEILDPKQVSKVMTLYSAIRFQRVGWVINN